MGKCAARRCSIICPLFSGLFERVDLRPARWRCRPRLRILAVAFDVRAGQQRLIGIHGGHRTARRQFARSSAFRSVSTLVEKICVALAVIHIRRLTAGDDHLHAALDHGFAPRAFSGRAR